jgi:hypothetical protein
MDWIFQNIEKLFPVIIFMLYALSAWRKRSSDEGDRSTEDPKEAERVRRIQEEIRRKIIARQQGNSLPAEAMPQQVEVERQVPASSPPDVPAAEVHRPYFAEKQRVRQEALNEKLRVAQAARIETARAVEVARKESKDSRWRQHVPEKRKSVGNFRPLLKNDLRQNSGLKRAFLLKEILGPPVGAEMGSLPRK